MGDFIGIENISSPHRFYVNKDLVCGFQLEERVNYPGTYWANFYFSERHIVLAVNEDEATRIQSIFAWED